MALTPKMKTKKFKGSLGAKEFRKGLGRSYDSQPLGDRSDFNAEIEHYRIGDIVFNQISFSSIRFERTTNHLERKGQDILVLERLINGKQVVLMDNAFTNMQQDRIYLRDWSYSFEAETDKMKLQSIVIPRKLLANSQNFDSINPVVSWSTNGATGSALLLLWDKLLSDFPLLNLQEATTLTAGLIGYIDCLLSSAIHDNKDATFENLSEYIQMNLREDITASTLCDYFNISRSNIYRLFAAHKGVNYFITHLRLLGSYKDLRRAHASETSINEVAAYWRFNDANSFTRAFKKKFDVTPSTILKTCAWRNTNSSMISKG